MNIHIWRHFLRNSVCLKKSIAWWCNDAIPMAREHHFIAIILSHHRHRVFAPSPSHFKTIALSSLHHRHCSIAPSNPNSVVRWYDSEQTKKRETKWFCYLHLSIWKTPKYMWSNQDLHIFFCNDTSYYNEETHKDTTCN